VERAVMDRIEHQIDREVRARFPDGAVRRVALLRHGDDPVIEPGELLVRVFIGAAGRPEDHQPEDHPPEDHPAEASGLWMRGSTLTRRG